MKLDLIKDIEIATIEELLIARTCQEAWIDSDCNDGRLSTGSSCELDYRWDRVDIINDELKHRKEIKKTATPESNSLHIKEI